MVKALILSALIGGMSPYLPFWRFDSVSQPVAVAIAMFILSFVVIYPDEIKRIGLTNEEEFKTIQKEKIKEVVKTLFDDLLGGLFDEDKGE